MNVPTNMNEEEIENVFLKYGQILKSFIAKPKPESQQKNTWACITYGTLEEAEAAIENLSKKSPHKFFIHRALSNEEKERQKKEVCGEEENGVTSFVMPQGQNDFNHDKVDQTVQIDKPKDTIVEREPIVQTLPENNLSRNYKNISNVLQCL